MHKYQLNWFLCKHMKVGMDVFQRFRNKILLGSGMVIVFVAIMSFVTLIKLNDYHKSIKQVVDHELNLLVDNEELSLMVSKRLAAIRGYILYQEEERLEEYQNLSKESKQMKNELLQHHNQDQEILDLIKLDNQFEKQVKEVIVKAKRGESFSNITQDLEQNVEPLSKDLFTTYEQQANQSENDILKHGQELVDSSNRLKWMVLLLTSLIVVSGFAIAIIIAKQTVAPIEQMVVRVKKMAKGDFTEKSMAIKSKDEIGQLSKHLNDMVDHLSVLIKEVNKSSNKITTFVSDVTKDVKDTSHSTQYVNQSIQDMTSEMNHQASIIASSVEVIKNVQSYIETVSSEMQIVDEDFKETNNKAKEGLHTVVDMKTQMNMINDKVTQASNVIYSLENHSKNIESIISTISDIADQTNLLSLNASIEAARAGEQGKGFSVVANEIRNLAEGSGKSAKEITQLIQEVQADTRNAVNAIAIGTTEVSEGLQLMEKSEHLFYDIKHSSDQVGSKIWNVHHVVNQMEDQNKQVSGVLEEINQIAHNNVAVSDQIASTTEEQLESVKNTTKEIHQLEQMIQQLRESTQYFKVD